MIADKSGIFSCQYASGTPGEPRGARAPCYFLMWPPLSLLEEGGHMNGGDDERLVFPHGLFCHHARKEGWPIFTAWGWTTLFCSGLHSHLNGGIKIPDPYLGFSDRKKNNKANRGGVVPLQTERFGFLHSFCACRWEWSHSFFLPCFIAVDDFLSKIFLYH